MSAEAPRLDRPPAEPGPSGERLYGLLADRRRRYALHYLRQRGEPVTLRELAEQVAAWENAKPIEALDSQERKRVYIAPAAAAS